jgi:hypothetical protein
MKQKEKYRSKTKRKEKYEKQKEANVDVKFSPKNVKQKGTNPFSLHFALKQKKF